MLSEPLAVFLLRSGSGFYESTLPPMSQSQNDPKTIINDNTNADYRHGPGVNGLAKHRFSLPFWAPGCGPERNKCWNVNWRWGSEFHIELYLTLITQAYIVWILPYIGSLTPKNWMVGTKNLVIWTGHIAGSSSNRIRSLLEQKFKINRHPHLDAVCFSFRLQRWLNRTLTVSSGSLTLKSDF